jgi:hypothetical protein
MAGVQNDPGTTQQEAGFGFNGRFWTESFNDGLTAKAGGAKTGATPIDSMCCRFATVANPGDSAMLPPTATGVALTVCVVNDSANAMTIYGVGANDTINGVANATGVTQMGKSVAWYTSTVAGKWLTQGLGSGYSGSNQTYSYADGLTALASGGQAGATAITTSIARFTTVANNGDSALLMPAAPGLAITVINASTANKTMAVYPNGTDQINGLGASLAIGIPPGAVVEFFTSLTGQWHSLISSGSGGSAQAYNIVSTVAGTINLTGAQITGGSTEVTLDLTGSQSGAVTLNLPTVGSLITAMTAAGVSPQVGTTYELDIIGRDGSHTYTLTTNTGWGTLNGTQTITAQMRKYYVTITSISSATASIQSIGTYTVGAA